MTTFIAIANHYWNIPSLKHQMGKDSVSGASMKTRTHSQAPARKRNRKGSWGGLNTLGLARTNSSANEISFIVSEKFRDITTRDRTTLQKVQNCFHILQGFHFLLLHQTVSFMCGHSRSSASISLHPLHPLQLHQLSACSSSPLRSSSVQYIQFPPLHMSKPW